MPFPTGLNSSSSSSSSPFFGDNGAVGNGQGTDKDKKILGPIPLNGAKPSGEVTPVSGVQAAQEGQSTGAAQAASIPPGVLGQALSSGTSPSLLQANAPKSAAEAQSRDIKTITQPNTAGGVQGHVFGQTQGKRPDSGLPAAVGTNSQGLTVSIDRTSGERTVTKESENKDGSTSTTIQKSDINGKPIATAKQEVNKDGSSILNSLEHKKDGGTVESSIAKDASGKISEASSVEKDKNGNVLSKTEQKKDENGQMTLEKKDADGKTISKAKVDENGKPVTDKEIAVKKKAEMEEKMKAKVADKLQDKDSKGPAATAYKKIDAAIAKLDPEKDKDAIDALKSKQGEIINKVTQNSLDKNEKYKEVSAEAAKPDAKPEESKSAMSQISDALPDVAKSLNQAAQAVAAYKRQRAGGGGGGASASTEVRLASKGGSAGDRNRR